jgi:hypothetical protein
VTVVSRWAGRRDGIALGLPAARILRPAREQIQ